MLRCSCLLPLSTSRSCTGNPTFHIVVTYRRPRELTVAKGSKGKRGSRKPAAEEPQVLFRMRSTPALLLESLDNTLDPED